MLQFERRLERVRMVRSDQYVRCFERHWWDGIVVNGEHEVLEPTLRCNEIYGGFKCNETHPFTLWYAKS